MGAWVELLNPTFVFTSSVSIYMSTFGKKYLFQISCPLQLSMQNHISKVISTPHISYLYFLDQPHTTCYDHLMQLICKQLLFLNCDFFKVDM